MEKLFKIEELHRGEWKPLMITDKNGNKVQKTIKITEFQAERNNVYSADYKLRYILSEDKKIKDVQKNIDKNNELSKINELRLEYSKVYNGKRPFHGWNEEQLAEKIAEKK